MKHIVFLTFFLLCNYSYSQTIKNENKLKNFYGTERYDYLMQQHPDLVKTLDFRISKGYVLFDEVNKKYKNLSIQNQFEKTITKTKKVQVSSQNIIDEIHAGTFNILRYNFGRKKDKDVIIRLDQNHILIIRSVRTLLNIRNNK